MYGANAALSGNELFASYYRGMINFTSCDIGACLLQNVLRNTKNTMQSIVLHEQYNRIQCIETVNDLQKWRLNSAKSSENKLASLNTVNGTSQLSHGSRH